MNNYQMLITSGIKNLRIKTGLTQEKFAEYTGISVEGLRNIEKDRYAPKPATIDSICAAFNITPFDLLLPDVSIDENLISEINSKLKLCKNDDLQRISKMIDIIRH